MMVRQRDMQVLERAKAAAAIKQRLRSQLGVRWPTGSRMPTIKALARLLETGETNTYRAVRQLADEGLLVSRPGQGTFVVDSVPAASARDVELDVAPTDVVTDDALKGMWTEMLRSPVLDPCFRAMLDAAAAVLLAQGCRVTEAGYTHGRDEPRPAAGHERCDGLIVFNPGTAQVLTRASQQALCVISTAVELNIEAAEGFDVVSADSKQGAFLAGRRLRDLGCRSMCFVGHCPGSVPFDETSLARLKGAELGWGEVLAPSHRLQTDSYRSVAAAEIVPAYLKLRPRPQGVFAASDELAMGFVHGAAAHGLRPGRDYHIIGFDGQHHTREMRGGPLTTVQVPSEEMGRTAAVLLSARLRDPTRMVRRVQLGCRLYEGATAALRA